MEGDQRVDLRDKIFREVIGNIIVHREYTDATATELIIEEDAVKTLNPNNPYFNGIMDLDNFNPHPKNPNLRRFFTALGWADEIGSGIRNTKKYLPFYVENAKPVFIDEPLFRTIIPLLRYTMSGFTKEWYNWLELDEKWLPKLAESLKSIEIDGHLQKMSWEEQVEYLIQNWVIKSTNLKELSIPVSDEKRFNRKEKTTKSYEEKGTSPDEKGHKSEKEYTIDNQQYDKLKGTSSDEKGCKLIEENRPNHDEKPTKLPNKKMRYIVVILLMLGTPLSIDELMSLFEYNHKGKFRDNYIKPLEAIGFITKTNPDKPTASNQKYVITEKGKRFLTGQDF